MTSGEKKLKATSHRIHGFWATTIERTVGGGGKDNDGTWMYLYLVKGVGHAIELCIGVLDKDLLNNPPDGRSIGNMVVQASRHS